MAKKRRSLTYYANKAVRGDDEIVVCAFDTETRGLGGDLLMVQWGTAWAGNLNIKHDSSEDMIDLFLNDVWNYPSPCIWYAHNAQYDFRYILPRLIELGIKFSVGMRTDTDIYEIRIEHNKKRYVMRDSFAIYSHKLEDLAKGFCPPELQKLEIDIENFDPNNPDHIKYARRDIEVLLVGLPKFFDLMLKHFGVNPAGTAAGTALKGWQKTLPDDTYFNAQPWGEQEMFIRQAYYGGIVFLTDTNKHFNVETYDINSSYPHQMETWGVPYGRMVECDDYQTDKMGIYRVRVKTPDDLRIPILPARDNRGNMRWFRGEFETVVTNRELVFAVNHGYEVLELYEGFVFEEVVYPFKDFIGKCKEIRFKHKGKAEEYVAKLFQNSLYGKFCSRRERLMMLPTHCSDDEDLLDATPYDAEGHWYVKKELDTEMRVLPSWGVFITAHARLHLLQTIYRVGVENVLYGDTDSITVKAGFGHLINQGNEYGQFKLEKEWKEFRAIAPKVYTGILKNGVRIGAAKGIPRKAITEQTWIDLMQDGQTHASALSLKSLRVALKSGKIEKATTLQRVSSSIRNSSNFDLQDDGTVKLKTA